MYYFLRITPQSIKDAQASTMKTCTQLLHRALKQDRLKLVRILSEHIDFSHLRDKMKAEFGNSSDIYKNFELLIAEVGKDKLSKTVQTTRDALQKCSQIYGNTTLELLGPTYFDDLIESEFLFSGGRNSYEIHKESHDDYTFYDREFLDWFNTTIGTLGFFAKTIVISDRYLFSNWSDQSKKWRKEVVEDTLAYIVENLFKFRQGTRLNVWILTCDTSEQSSNKKNVDDPHYTNLQVFKKNIVTKICERLESKSIEDSYLDFEVYNSRGELPPLTNQDKVPHQRFIASEYGYVYSDQGWNFLQYNKKNERTEIQKYGCILGITEPHPRKEILERIKMGKW